MFLFGTLLASFESSFCKAKEVLCSEQNNVEQYPAWHICYHKPMANLKSITQALQLSWGADTSYSPDEWSKDNIARGQCVVSSLVVQDYLSGELIRYSVNEGDLHETHYVNKLDSGVIIDTTASQYKYPVNMRLKPTTLDSFCLRKRKAPRRQVN